jgi:hypothetical protein
MSAMPVVGTFDIVELNFDELNLVDGGSSTAQALRDFAAGAAIVGGVAAWCGAEPVAIGAAIAGGTALLAAAIIG